MEIVNMVVVEGENKYVNQVDKFLCKLTGRGRSPLALRLTLTPAANDFASLPSFTVPCN